MLIIPIHLGFPAPELLSADLTGESYKFRAMTPYGRTRGVVHAT